MNLRQECRNVIEWDSKSDANRAVWTFRMGHDPMCLQKSNRDFELRFATLDHLSILQGNAQGQFNYGLCLDNDEGVPRNFDEAARYFKMAADQGNDAAAPLLSLL